MPASGGGKGKTSDLAATSDFDGKTHYKAFYSKLSALPKWLSPIYPRLTPLGSNIMGFQPSFQSPNSPQSSRHLPRLLVSRTTNPVPRTPHRPKGRITPQANIARSVNIAPNLASRTANRAKRKYRAKRKSPISLLHQQLFIPI